MGICVSIPNIFAGEVRALSADTVIAMSRLGVGWIVDANGSFT